MYVSILDALDLTEGQSFLNIGSGSGYVLISIELRDISTWSCSIVYSNVQYH